MTQKEMELTMENIFKEIQRMREAGQKEYARKSSNAFANFERIGSNLNLSREKVLLVYLLKHIDGISSYIDGHEMQREDIRGRITDALVYLCLLWGMIDESEQKNK